MARRGRSEARPRDRHLLDLHRRARAERLHLRGARRRLDGGRLWCFALVGGRRALGTVARRRSGARPADARRRRSRRLDRRLRQRAARQRRPPDGFRSPGLPGGRPQVAAPARNRDGSGLTAVRRRRGARAGGPRRAAPAQARSRPRDERRVLVSRRPGRRRGAANSGAGDVRLLAHRRLVGPHSRAEAARPPRSPVCQLRRPRPTSARGQLMDLGQAAALADEYAKGGLERELATLRSEWADEIEASCRSNDYRVRALAYRAIAQFRFRQKLELLRRGLEDDSPAVRGSALIALEGLSRSHPGDVNAYRPLLHELASRDPNVAVRRLAIVCFKNGTPARETILILDGIADDDETDAEVRKTARSVSLLLVKKSNQK